MQLQFDIKFWSGLGQSFDVHKDAQYLLYSYAAYCPAYLVQNWYAILFNDFRFIFVGVVTGVKLYKD